MALSSFLMPIFVSTIAAEEIFGLSFFGEITSLFLLSGESVKHYYMPISEFYLACFMSSFIFFYYYNSVKVL
jgi:hypothetical protein